MGKVIFDVEKVANFCRLSILSRVFPGRSRNIQCELTLSILSCLQGDLETFDAIILSIFSLTLQGDSNIRYVFIDSIE